MSKKTTKTKNNKKSKNGNEKIEKIEETKILDAEKNKNKNKNINTRDLRAGIDVGSTTVKLVIIDSKTDEKLYSKYVRHNSCQLDAVINLIKEAKSIFKDETMKIAVCGSGGKPIAEKLNVSYIQEVVANATAVCKLYPNVKTAIELRRSRRKGYFLLF